MPRLRRRLRVLAIVLALAAASPAGFAQADTASDRPRVGLVLSGGGARGAAHIGVLKVLESMRVPIDAVAGTSMGAVVGGLYASGLTATEIEDVIASVNWQEAFSDRPPRADLTFRRKEEDRNFLVQLPLGLRAREFRLPRGLLQGQRVSEMLRRLTLPVGNIEEFDALPTRFRAIATDLETGERVALGQGDLALAMRASLSAPGFFTPVEYGGRLLVDGGLTGNLPVDIARAMGVDLLVVVDVGFPLLPRGRLDSAPVISNQMLAILIGKESERQRATLTPRDVLIAPPIGESSSFDFSRIPQLIVAGEAAARGASASLAALARPEAEYAAYAARRDAVRAGSLPHVDFVRVEPGSERYARAIGDVFGGFAGAPLDPDGVARGITTLYGQGNLEVLDYRVAREGHGEGVREGLAFTARRNSWGPNYIRFGLNLSDDFEGNAAYNAAARFVLSEINDLGAEWVWDLQIGESPRAATEVFLPMSYTARWFFLPRVEVEERNIASFLDGERIAEYRVRTFAYGLDFGRELGTSAELRAGYRRLSGSTRARLGVPTLPTGDFDLDEFSARFAFDRLNDVNFPRLGSSLFLEWRGGRADDSLGTDTDLLELDWLAARSWGRNTAILWTSAGIDVASGPGDVRTFYRLGGLLNLSGLSRGEVTGRHFALARAIYLRQIGRAGAGFLDVPTYVGLSYELGNAWDERGDISLDSARSNVGLFLGLDTLLGPVYLGGGWDEEGERAYSLSLGRSF
jgi:NTE family protein